MPYFILSYRTSSDFQQLREPYRTEHLALVHSFVSTGKLLLGGALEGQQGGALLVFQVAAKEEVAAFVNADPYVAAGLVHHWEIKEWTVVAGSLYL